MNLTRYSKYFKELKILKLVGVTKKSRIKQEGNARDQKRRHRLPQGLIKCLLLCFFLGGGVELGLMGFNSMST